MANVPFHTHTFTIPDATEAQAVAGTSTDVAMTPKATTQAIAAQVGVTLASVAQGLKADTAIQPATLSTANILLPASGLTRKLQDKIEEGRISITDFGAVGGDTVKDTLAFKDAVSKLQLLGIDTNLWIPEGEFNLDEQISISQASGKSRINLKGYGSNVSGVFFLAPNQASEYPAFVFQGGTWGTSETTGPDISGFKLRGWGGQNLAGITFKKQLGIRMTDVILESLAFDMRLEDVVVANFKSCGFQFGSKGITGAPGAGAPVNGSAPNEIHFDTCSWIAKGAYGIDLTGSGNIKITSGSFEGCGHDAANFAKANRYSAKYNDMGYNAAGMVTYDTVHHEGNEGTADVWINHNQRPGTYHFINTDWTRNGGVVSQTDNHIRFDTTGTTKASVVVDGGGFMNVNGYTPSAARPVIAYGTVSGNNHCVSWRGATFESRTERPTMINGDIGPGGVPWMKANFAGSAVGTGLAGVNYSENISSVVKNGAGDFTINASRARPTGGVTIIFGSVIGFGSIVKIGETEGLVRFQTLNSSGVPTDFGETQIIVISPISWMEQ